MGLTEHFTLEEFRCRCGCGAEKNLEDECLKTAQLLETARDKLNHNPELWRYRESLPGGLLKEFSVTINCGVRCPKHNKEVGGASKSRHLSVNYEGAVDSFVPGLPVALWARELSRLFPGCILYTKKNFVHADRRSGETYCAVDGKPVSEITEA